VSPFSSYKKRSATVIRNPNRPHMVTIYLKGAPEVVLDMCLTVQSANGSVPLSPKIKEEISIVVDEMAKKPLRVIAFAYFELEWEQYDAQFI